MRSALKDRVKCIENSVGNLRYKVKFIDDYQDKMISKVTKSLIELRAENEQLRRIIKYAPQASNGVAVGYHNVTLSGVVGTNSFGLTVEIESPEFYCYLYNKGEEYRIDGLTLTCPQFEMTMMGIVIVKDRANEYAVDLNTCTFIKTR